MKRVFTKVLFAIDLLLTFSTTAFAYLDPWMMTYTIQVVAGGVVTVGGHRYLLAQGQEEGPGQVGHQ